MQNINLQRLTLRHFKGVQELTIEPEGQDANIFGANATGKTTIFDAFLWLLFDKDSQNRKDFQIKTVDDYNREIHGLTNEVEAVMVYGGQAVTLTKSYREKWTKKRGAQQSTFTGHTTDYKIDGVPANKAEFNAKISEIVQENTFKELTSPSYFNQSLKWQERRERLLAIGGDVSDDEVFRANPELEPLKTALENRNVSGHKKMVMAKRKEINDELERLPVRINEAARSMPDTPDQTKDELQARIESLNGQIDEAKNEKRQIEQSDQQTAVQNELARLKGERLTIENKHRQAQQTEYNEKSQQINALKRESDQLRNTVQAKEAQAGRKSEEAMDVDDAVANLRESYATEKNKTFEAPHETTCPTCRQELPADQIETARERAEADFNHEKAESLEKIAAEGKKKSEYAKQLRSEAEGLQEQAAENSKQADALEDQISQLTNERDSLTSLETVLANDSDYQAIKEKEQSLQQSLGQTEAPNTDEIDETIKQLQQQAQQVEAQLAMFDQRAKTQARINELEQEEEKMAAEYERLEQELYLTESFTRTKVNMLEQQINSKFKYANFKLFKTNINGGIEETCETLYEGVPYSAGLNNAARINVGLDIINTLSTHYGVQAPIFIDNREAVSQLIDTDAQIINLIVSDQDKQLRVENNQLQEVS